MVRVFLVSALLLTTLQASQGVSGQPEGDEADVQVFVPAQAEGPSDVQTFVPATSQEPSDTPVSKEAPSLVQKIEELEELANKAIEKKEADTQQSEKEKDLLEGKVDQVHDKLSQLLAG